jgi:hypothetical protein
MLKVLTQSARCSTRLSSIRPPITPKGRLDEKSDADLEGTWEILTNK